VDSSNLVGTRLGKYEIRAEIGRGGMGTVYKGYDPMLDSWVAVKVLAPHLVWEQKFIERFIREARAARKLRHPGIVTVYDVGQEAGWYYIVMEYLEGQTLTELIRERGPMPLEEAVHILRPLAEALDYAHHKGLVHRDIKPGNVIVDPAGQVTLTDFGIARAARETRLTATGAVVGTPEYMSPEQVKGLMVDARSDQYSLAVVAYEILSGRVPFEAESTLALLYKVVHEPPPPIRQARPDLPAGVEAVLKKTLAKEPGDRYATASGFVDALERALAGEEVVKAPTLVMEPKPKPYPVTTSLPQQEPPPAPPPPPEPQPEPRPETTPLPQPELRPVPSPSLLPRIEKGVRKRLRAIPGWGWALGGLAVLVVAVVAFLALRPMSSLPKSYPVFVSDREGKREIYRLTEGEVVRVTHTPGHGESWAPVLAPGGDILFTSNREGKREVYRLTEGEAVRVTHTPGDGGSGLPVPAPGGDILFTSNRDGKREVYRLTEGEVVRVTHTTGHGESWLPVSAPGGDIIFTSNREGKREIYRLTEGEVVRVTHTPGNGESWAPVSAPGGDILFTSNREGKREIYRLTEGEVVRVTHTPGHGESWAPVLAPGGDILFTSNRDGKREIYRLTDGEVVRVTHTPGDGESWSLAR